MKVRAASMAGAALLVAGLLGGCSLIAVHQTLHPYDASDGVSASVGDVRVINAIVFTEDGEDGNFTGAAVNRGDRDVTLTLQYVSDGQKVDIEVDVPAGETTRLGGDDAQILLPGIGVQPGGLLKIYFQYAGNPGKQIDVPVLDASLSEYDGLLPTPTPTPTPTETALPDPAVTETPAP